MLSAYNTAALFLINTLFDLYIFVWILRVIFIWIHADYFNPVSQLVIKLTQPIAKPLRRVLPMISGVEWGSILMIVLLELCKFLLSGLITVGFPNLAGLILLSMADMLKATVNVFFYAILLQAILSWVHTGYSPIHQLLNQLTAPVLRPFQRVIPPVAGFDISPIPALITLQLLIILLVNPLQSTGIGMAFG